MPALFDALSVRAGPLNKAFRDAAADPSTGRRNRGVVQRAQRDSHRIERAAAWGYQPIVLEVWRTFLAQFAGRCSDGNAAHLLLKQDARC